MSADLIESVTANLVEIWGRTLGVADVPVNANFFELGGRSATFVRVALEIEDRYGIELSLRDFFNAPTVSELAGNVVRAIERENADT